MKRWPNFASPHVHPASLDSASTLEQFAVRELELGSPTLTCTDHGTMAATRSTYSLARDKKKLKKLVGHEVQALTPILGIEGYLRDDDCPILGAKYPKDANGTYKSTFRYGHLLIHFLDQAAYELGTRLLTRADLERGERAGSKRKPLFTWADLEELGAANTTISSGCFLPGTYAQTNSGLKFVEQVVAGEEIFDRRGVRRVVAVPTTRQWNGKVVKFDSQVLMSPVECTDDHKVLVWKFGTVEPVWVRADELVKGDRLCFSVERRPNLRSLPFEFSYESPKPAYNRVLRGDFADPETLWVLGFFIAEGSLRQGQVVFSTHREKDQSRRDRVTRWANAWDVNTSEVHSKKSLGTELYINSVVIASWFMSIFDGPTSAHTKKIPERLKDLHPDLLAYLFAGYAEGDGFLKSTTFLDKNKKPYEARRFTVATVSRQLADDIMSILRRIDARYHTFLSKAHVGNDRTKHADSFYIKAQGDDADYIWRWISGRSRHLNIDGLYTAKVSTIEVRSYEGAVHCLNIDQEPSFSLEGGLVVHNCLIGAVARHLKDNDDYDTAIAYYQRLRGLCRPGRFLVEVFPRRCDKNWTQAVFVTTADGVTHRFHDQKNLRIGPSGSEMHARDLQKAWARGTHQHAPQSLLAVMEQRVWRDREPQVITKVSRVEGYVANEACGYAPDGDLQKGLNRFMLELATHFGDRVVICDDSHYATPDDKVVQDVRLGAGSGGGWRFLPGYHRLSSDEAYEVFKATLGTSEAEFGRWVDNTLEWASWFKDFRLEAKPALATRFYPEDTLGHALDLIQSYGRFDPDDQAQVARLSEEIAILHGNGTIDLLPYFFPVKEVVKLYEDNGLLTGPGRGSAAGLLLSYLIGITHVDPLRYGLSLERFITLDRIQAGKFPDIDQDLPHRDLLVDPEDWHKGWLRERFGGCVSQISTLTKLKLRSSIKDVHRALNGSVPPEVEELTAQMWTPAQGVDDKDFIFGYEEAGAFVEGSIKQDKALQDYIRRWPKEWVIVQKCLGLGRQRGRHACAYAISNRIVGDVVPLTEVGGVGVTSFSAGGVEEAGLVKYDFLTINSLRDISAALGMIHARYPAPPPQGVVIRRRHVPAMRLVPHAGGWVDAWDPPEDDAVFAEISAGRTETDFQLNTAGARKWLRHFNHRRVDGRRLISSIPDVAIFTSLDRPGPLDVLLQAPGACEHCSSTRKVAGKPCPKCHHNALVEYARRARGMEPSPSIPPKLEKLLPETYGIMVTQEQLQATFKQLVGCTGAQAEEFRRAVAKKEAEKVRNWYEPFMEGVVRTTGATREEAKEIWEFYATWATYGFNYSHAVCYALIGYTCAWLKHHYPLEWWCAVLRNAPKDEVCETFWPHVGHLVDLPDISRSGDDWEIQGRRLRAPLKLLDGVGPAAHAELVAGKPYADIAALCRHVRAVKDGKAKPYVDAKGTQRVCAGTAALHRGVVYKLIAAGSLDSLFPAGALLPDKLVAYEAALAAALGGKRQPVKPDYLALDALGRYQLRKAVLPVYGADLRPAIREFKLEGQEHVPLQVTDKLATDHMLGTTKTTPAPHVVWAGEAGILRRRGEAIPLVGVGELQMLRDPRASLGADALATGGDGVVRVAAVAYVQSVESFSYGPGRSKRATKWVLEVGGQIAEHVQWPRRDRPAQSPDLAPAGSVVVAALTRLGADLVADEVYLVRLPLDWGKKVD